MERLDTENTKILGELMSEIADIESGSQEFVAKQYGIEGLRGLVLDLAAHIERLQKERDVYATKAQTAEAALSGFLMPTPTGD